MYRVKSAGKIGQDGGSVLFIGGIITGLITFIIGFLNGSFVVTIPLSICLWLLAIYGLYQKNEYSKECTVEIDETQIRFYRDDKLEACVNLYEVKELTSNCMRTRGGIWSEIILKNSDNDLLHLPVDRFTPSTLKEMFVEIAKYSGQYNFIAKDPENVFQVTEFCHQDGRMEEPSKKSDIPSGDTPQMIVKCPKCSGPIPVKEDRTFPLVKCPSCASPPERKLADWLLHINPDNQVFDQCPRCKKYCLISASIKKSTIEFKCTKCSATFPLDARDAIELPVSS